MRARGYTYQHGTKPMREVLVNTKCIVLNESDVGLMLHHKPRCKVLINTEYPVLKGSLWKTMAKCTSIRWGG